MLANANDCCNMKKQAVLGPYLLGFRNTCCQGARVGHALYWALHSVLRAIIHPFVTQNLHDAEERAKLQALTRKLKTADPALWYL